MTDRQERSFSNRLFTRRSFLFTAGAGMTASASWWLLSGSEKPLVSDIDANALAAASSDERLAKNAQANQHFENAMDNAMNQILSLPGLKAFKGVEVLLRPDGISSENPGECYCRMRSEPEKIYPLPAVLEAFRAYASLGERRKDILSSEAAKLHGHAKEKLGEFITRRYESQLSALSKEQSAVVGGIIERSFAMGCDLCNLERPHFKDEAVALREWPEKGWKASHARISKDVSFFTQTIPVSVMVEKPRRVREATVSALP
jgi:hypothetical protein